jgi:4-diphosphocytidyl-2-C-methyl-D-erythritol kinase
LTVEAYAKVNLTLEILGLRPDGYHDLRSVVLPISLADTIEVERADGVSSDTGIPGDLCVKAAEALDVGARIRVVKRIPAGGGLGGGSADAAAVLVALNSLYGLGHSPERLAEIGAEVGSDVPALVLGHIRRAPVLMEGRGERVSPLPAMPVDLVLVFPQVHSSTREVFSRWRPEPPSESAPTGLAAAALARGDIAALAAALANDLEPSATSLHPEIAAALAALREEKPLAAAMTGSGSTVFALVRSPDEAAALAARLRARGFSAAPLSAVSAEKG